MTDTQHAQETQHSDVSALLEVRDVRRSFGDVVALDGVSLDVQHNEFFAILGPSGCGKTTLLRILAGFEHPDDGQVSLEGDDLLRLPPHRRPVNLMFQSYALFPHMSVERNVAYGLEREGCPKGEVRQRVGDVLDHSWPLRPRSAPAQATVRRATAARGVSPGDRQTAQDSVTR